MAGVLTEAQRIYDEPGPFIVWGLLLVVLGIVFVAWHIALSLGIATLASLGLILWRLPALHRTLRAVLSHGQLPYHATAPDGEP